MIIRLNESSFYTSIVSLDFTQALGQLTLTFTRIVLITIIVSLDNSNVTHRLTRRL